MVCDALKLLVLFRFNAWPHHTEITTESSTDTGPNSLTAGALVPPPCPETLDVLHGQLSYACGELFTQLLERVLHGLQGAILGRKRDLVAEHYERDDRAIHYSGHL